MVLNSSLFKDIVLIKPETNYKNSRFDFYIETTDSKIFIEVKGVTLRKMVLLYFLMHQLSVSQARK